MQAPRHIGSAKRRARNMASIVGATVILGVLSVGSLRADPIVQAGGQPGVATHWTSTGKMSTALTIGAVYNAEEVAKAISKGVAGATAKAKGDKVFVTGVATGELLKALEKVELEPALDDIDAMLTALQAPATGTGEGSGSSIRATKSADFSDVMGDQVEQIAARVVSVKRERFPLVFVTVQIESTPKDGKLLPVKKGQKITVLPRVKSKNGLVDPEDKASKLNVGAWYAQPGDKVKIRLEEERRNVWIAAGFDRSKPEPR